MESSSRNRGEKRLKHHNTTTDHHNSNNYNNQHQPQSSSLTRNIIMLDEQSNISNIKLGLRSIFSIFHSLHNNCTSHHQIQNSQQATIHQLITTTNHHDDQHHLYRKRRTRRKNSLLMHDTKLPKSQLNTSANFMNVSNFHLRSILLLVLISLATQLERQLLQLVEAQCPVNTMTSFERIGGVTVKDSLLSVLYTAPNITTGPSIGGGGGNKVGGSSKNYPLGALDLTRQLGLVGGGAGVTSNVNDIPITAECNNRCRRDNKCRAFLVDYARHICYSIEQKSPVTGGSGGILGMQSGLMRGSASQVSYSLIPTQERMAYFERICLQIPQIECERAWIYERVLAHHIQDPEAKIIEEVPNRLKCQEHCLNEREFKCRSGVYDYLSMVCKLSMIDRHIKPNSFRPSLAHLDYFENQCVSVGNQCDAFDRFDDMDLGRAEILRFANTSDQCQQLCTQIKAFICRSFTWNPLTGKCYLNSQNSFTVGGLDRLISAPGLIYYQRNDCIDLKLECDTNAMTLNLRTNEPFRGRMYVRDEPNACESLGRSSLHSSLSIPFHSPTGATSRCATRELGSRYSSVVVVQQHPLIQRKSDRYIKVVCDFQTSNKTITSTYNVVANPWTSTALINATSFAPKIRLRITDRNGVAITSAKLGDELFLRIEAESESVYDMVARSVLAKSGNTDETIALIDKDGCPTDYRIFPPLKKLNRRTIVGKFDAFKFSSDVVVRFQVDVQFCLNQCPPTSCDHNLLLNSDSPPQIGGAETYSAGASSLNTASIGSSSSSSSSSSSIGGASAAASELMPSFSSSTTSSTSAPHHVVPTFQLHQSQHNGQRVSPSSLGINGGSTSSNNYSDAFITQPTSNQLHHQHQQQSVYSDSPSTTPIYYNSPVGPAHHPNANPIHQHHLHHPSSSTSGAKQGAQQHHINQSASTYSTTHSILDSLSDPQMFSSDHLSPALNSRSVSGAGNGQNAVALPKAVSTAPPISPPLNSLGTPASAASASTTTAETVSAKPRQRRDEAQEIRDRFSHQQHLELHPASTNPIDWSDSQMESSSSLIADDHMNKLGLSTAQFSGIDPLEASESQESHEWHENTNSQEPANKRRRRRRRSAQLSKKQQHSEAATTTTTTKHVPLQGEIIVIESSAKKLEESQLGGDEFASHSLEESKQSSGAATTHPTTTNPSSSSNQQHGKGRSRAKKAHSSSPFTSSSSSSGSNGPPYDLKAGNKAAAAPIDKDDDSWMSDGFSQTSSTNNNNHQQQQQVDNGTSMICTTRHSLVLATVAFCTIQFIAIVLCLLTWMHKKDAKFKVKHPIGQRLY